MNKTIFSKKRFSFLDTVIYRWRRKMIQPYVSNNKKVCDLGCGEDGYLLQELKDDIASGIGFDLTIDSAFQDKKIKLYKANLNEPISLANMSIDTVFSLAVLEHLLEPTLHIHEIFRILNNNGTLVLTTPSPYAKPILEILSFLKLINKDSIRDHKHYFTKQELINLCKKAGFKEITFNYFQIVCNQLVIAKK